MSEPRVTICESRVGGGDAAHRRSAARTLTTCNSRLATRQGVTLVELLITITIISILSGLFLGTSRLAMESSRESRTKTLVSKINGLLMEKWNEYATRRVDVHPAIIAAVDNNLMVGGNWTPQARQVRGLALADLRLLATRELMKLEMPDRWSDVMINDITGDNVNSVGVGSQSVLSSVPAITNVYRRRFQSFQQQGLSSEVVLQNQGAECLYMIIMNTTADGEARTLFSEQNIGDTDGDGAFEFLDGWGRPIDFIRWPAGFYDRSDLMAGPTLSNLGTGPTANLDHDPTDMFRRDVAGMKIPGLNVYPKLLNNALPSLGPPSVVISMRRIRQRSLNEGLELESGTTTRVGAFRLLPLVFSWGPDGESDIDAAVDDKVRNLNSIDPYAIDVSLRKFELGRPIDANQDGDDNSLDNIHNHLLDNR